MLFVYQKGRSRMVVRPPDNGEPPAYQLTVPAEALEYSPGLRPGHQRVWTEDLDVFEEGPTEHAARGALQQRMRHFFDTHASHGFEGLERVLSFNGWQLKRRFDNGASGGQPPPGDVGLVVSNDPTLG